jgi:hypothetical protein
MTDQQNKEYQPVEESGATEPKPDAHCNMCEAVDGEFYIGPQCHDVPVVVRCVRNGDTATLIIECSMCYKKVVCYQVLESEPGPATQSLFSSHRANIYIFRKDACELQLERAQRKIRWFESDIQQAEAYPRCGKRDPARCHEILLSQAGKCAGCGETEIVFRVDHHPDGEIRRLLCLDCSLTSALMGYERATEIVNNLWPLSGIRAHAVN